MIADNIKARLTKYYSKKRRAVFCELGLVKDGKCRADLFVLAMNGHVVVVECKSTVADFRADHKKKLSFIDYCNQAYYAMPESVYVRVKALIPKGVGCFIMDETGSYLRKVTKAMNMELDSSISHNLAIRGAFRNADNSNRKNKRAQVSEQETRSETSTPKHKRRHRAFS